MKKAKAVEAAKSMTKSKLITEVSEVTGLSEADTTRAFEALLQSIQAELQKGNDIRITGLGTFGVSQREAREGRNPRTGEVIKLPAIKLPKFRAGTALREALG